ncbi:MAG: PAS domain-containing protein, partial [Proteobacteria bacterium]|nr:PAS domain-containing protein [Pseudomonadota bacterium]
MSVAPLDPGLSEAFDISALAVLAALASPVLVVDRGQLIHFVNHAAEDFFATGAEQLLGRALSDVVGFDSPLTALADQACARGA